MPHNSAKLAGSQSTKETTLFTSKQQSLNTVFWMFSSRKRFAFAALITRVIKSGRYCLRPWVIIRYTINHIPRWSCLFQLRSRGTSLQLWSVMIGVDCAHCCACLPESGQCRFVCFRLNTLTGSTCQAVDSAQCECVCVCVYEHTLSCWHHVASLWKTEDKFYILQAVNGKTCNL